MGWGFDNAKRHGFNLSRGWVGEFRSDRFFMSDVLSIKVRPPKDLKTFWASRAGELAVATLVWFSIHEFAHLRLSALEAVGVLAGWFTIWLLAALGRTRCPGWGWVWSAVEWLAPEVILAMASGRLSHSLTIGQQFYTVLAVGAVVTGWRKWLWWRGLRGSDPVAEPLRVLAVGAAALGVLLPFFTDRLIGGTDERWYAMMLHDFVLQLHAGVFPVFIGQGEYAWNGAVHLFRSAPVYMHVAGAWDFVTLRSLNAPALQHLTILTAGLVGSLGFYAAAAALLPNRRWMAAGFAVLYTTASAWLGILYWAEAIMTFMGMAAMPAVLYGNARSLLAEDGRGYRWLAVGLALVWMCHPPIALLATLLTVLLQGGSLMWGRASAARWRGVLIGALWFAGLSAYYFVSMSEVPRTPGSSRADMLQMVGLILALAGLGNVLVRQRFLGWWSLALLGVVIAGLGRSPWWGWLGLTTVLLMMVLVVLKWSRREVARGTACVILFVTLVIAAGLTQAWIGPNHPSRNLETLGIFRSNVAHQSEWLRPVPADLGTLAMYQPGAGLWLMFGILAVAFGGRGSLVVKLFFIAACVPFFGLVGVPWVGEFLVGFAPDAIARIVNLPLVLRLTPIFTAMLAMGGVVWLATAAPVSRLRCRIEGSVLLALVVWGLIQAAPFMRRGWSVTTSRTRTENHFLTENFVLERFCYDLVQPPAYLTFGRVDPWLQTRVLDVNENVVIGPDETARIMENAGARRLRLTARDLESNPVWAILAPDVTIGPKERLMLRFEFQPKVNYAGWLIWSSTHGYREYHLPDAGLALAFGAEAPNSRVVVLGNSGDTAETYHLTYSRQAGNSVGGKADLFADVIVSRYQPELASVRVEELMPCYRVAATLPGAGWIETSRVWLPGYRAILDGKLVQFRRSHRGLVMAAAGPGLHRLELRYVGTTTLWIALIVSVLTWIGGGVWALWRWLSPKPQLDHL